MIHDGPVSIRIELPRELLRHELQARFGVPIRCGDGWLALIARCLDEMGPVEVRSIFANSGGTFTILADWGVFPAEQEPRVLAIIQRHQEESRTVCEVCGRPGSPVTMNMTLHTRCQLHIRTLIPSDRGA